MALKTLGTNAVNSLSAFVVGTNDLTPADMATINNAMRADPSGYSINPPVGTVRPRLNQSYVKQGLLFIPNRGQLRLKPGDWIGIDANTGWPIVVSGDTAANGTWTHN